jgi:hypothetical protein
MRKWVVSIGLCVFLGGSLMAQGLFWKPGHPAGAGRHTIFGPLLGPYAGFSRANVGIFPVFQVPREVAAGFLVHQFIFGDHQPVRAGRPYYWTGGPASPMYWGHYGSVPLQPMYAYPTVHDMAFVQAWKDRVPPEVAGSGLSKSILLSKGMEEEEIVRVIGSPVQRIRLGEREVWKYSGYSLLLENGTLQDIR